MPPVSGVEADREALARLEKEMGAMQARDRERLDELAAPGFRLNDLRSRRDGAWKVVARHSCILA